MSNCKGLIRAYTRIPKPGSKTQQTKANETFSRIGCSICGATNKTLYRQRDQYVCKEHRGS